MWHSEQQLAVARARDEFIVSGRIPDGVRPETARSWRRSVLAGLRPDGELKLRFSGDMDDDSALLRAVRPVASDLTEQFADAGAAMLLADKDGRVVGRWARGRLLAHLNEISSCPGFVFDEATVGTSALGTALEDGAPVTVQGAEHFMSCLDNLCAVGSPIRHPATGRIEGALDIVCLAGTPTTFILPLITRAAQEAEDRLLSGYSAADRALLNGFLQTDRRGHARPVMAVNKRILMANALAGDVLGAGTARHATLWEQVDRALQDGRTVIVVEADGPTGPVHGSLRELRNAGEAVGALIHLHRPRVSKSGPSSSFGRNRGVYHQLLERVPGRSELWRGLVRRCARLAGGEGRLLLVGSHGVGKARLATALLEVGASGDAVVRLDARDIPYGNVHEWITRADAGWREGNALLLAHLEQLDTKAREIVCRWLDDLPPAGRPIIGTFRTSDAGATLPPLLLSEFEHIIDVPSIDDRREDIPDIVAAVLDAQEGLPVRIDPPALRQLMSREWPGNARQLRRAVLAARDLGGGRTIRETDLPAVSRTGTTRMRLSRLERVERDAIAAALAASAGNKRAAAGHLGISRSTLYRKMAALGLPT